MRNLYAYLHRLLVEARVERYTKLDEARRLVEFEHETWSMLTKDWLMAMPKTTATSAVLLDQAKQVEDVRTWGFTDRVRLILGVCAQHLEGSSHEANSKS